MIQGIDIHKLNNLTAILSSPDELRREGTLFTIGGNLPIYSTLETMYESYCQESAELFLVTFGGVESFGQNLEMVRQIKKNFSTRLMGRIDHQLTASQVEQAYMAGLDLLDIQIGVHGGEEGVDHEFRSWKSIFRSAVGTFPGWSVISSVRLDMTSPEETRIIMLELLNIGVIPMLVPGGNDCTCSAEETGALFSFLAEEWHRHRVQIKPVLPLLRLASPFAFSDTSGFFRTVIDKLQDHHLLAASDLRRHLRTSGAEASFESAGL